MAQGSLAQIAVTVTSDDGGDSIANSLGWAVTHLNANGGGSVSIDPALSPITLTQPLAASTQNVTLLGDINSSNSLQILGQDNSQSQLLFQQGFNQQYYLLLQNASAAGTALDASVTASTWTMDSGVWAHVFAATGAATVTTGGTGVLGTDGGNAWVSVGDFTSGSVQLQGGNGGGVTDTNGTNDIGGDGGSVSVVGNNLVMNGGIFQLAAGGGGWNTDLGSGTNTGGAGGSAYLSFTSITSGPNGNLSLYGGRGGTGTTGGDGGGVTALTGALTLTAGFITWAGDGGVGTTASGNGGDAFVSLGSYTDSTNANFDERGGTGGSNLLTAGNGGNAFLQAGTVDINGSSSSFQVLGGLGGTLGAFSTSAPNGGNGGSVAVSIGALNLQSGSVFHATGGNGGHGSSGPDPGNGGNGGGTSIIIGSFTNGVSTSLYISSGYGADGGYADPGGTAGNAGNGGDLGVSIGSLNMATGSLINFIGGSGGMGGSVTTGGTGGAGGNGGNVNVYIGAVTMASGNYLGFTGGSGGYGGTADINGANGAAGLAYVYMNDLEGSGNVQVNGVNSVLAVAQGDYAGSIGGTNSNLLKSGSGSLTLSGTNYYGGGTSIVVGTLLVDTGGTLGTGGVEDFASLDYIHSSVGVNTVSVENGGVLRFLDSSSAGTGNFNLLNGSVALFSGTAVGGTSTFELWGGSTLDVGGSAQGVTIGSLDGAGSAVLGAENLSVGANGSATTFVGTLTGTGTLGIVGGNLTLAGTDNLAGGTHVSGGTLTAGSSTALGNGPVTVSGGTLSIPAGMALTVGSYTGSGTGTLGLDITPGSSGELIATGSANLGGIVHAAVGGGSYALRNQYLILSSGSMSGLFSGISSDSAYFDNIATLTYGANSVTLNLFKRNAFAPFANTVDQEAVAGALGQAVIDGSDAFYAQVNELYQLPSGQAGAFDQLGGEIYSVLPSVLEDQWQVEDELVLGRMNGTEGSFLRSASLLGSPLWAGDQLLAAARGNLSAGGKSTGLSAKGLWLTNSDGSGTVNSTNQLQAFTKSNYGFLGGYDAQLSKSLIGGIMASYVHNDVTAVDATGKTGIDGFGGGLYGSLATGKLEWGLAGRVAVDHFVTNRSVSFGTQSAALKGATDGLQYGGVFQGSYPLQLSKVSLIPAIGLHYDHLSENAFNETGSGTLGLSVAAQNYDSFRPFVGVAASGPLDLDVDLTAVPSLALSASQELNNVAGKFQADFAGAPNDKFIILSNLPGAATFGVGAGLELHFGKQFYLFGGYNGHFSSSQTLNTLNAGANVSF